MRDDLSTKVNGSLKTQFTTYIRASRASQCSNIVVVIQVKMLVARNEPELGYNLAELQRWTSPQPRHIYHGRTNICLQTELRHPTYTHIRVTYFSVYRSIAYLFAPLYPTTTSKRVSAFFRYTPLVALKKTTLSCIEIALPVYHQHGRLRTTHRESRCRERNPRLRFERSESRWYSPPSCTLLHQPPTNIPRFL